MLRFCEEKFWKARIRIERENAGRHWLHWPMNESHDGTARSQRIEVHSQPIRRRQRQNINSGLKHMRTDTDSIRSPNTCTPTDQVERINETLGMKNKESLANSVSRLRAGDRGFGMRRDRGRGASDSGDPLVDEREGGHGRESRPNRDGELGGYRMLNETKPGGARWVPEAE
ncbi:hypothetical protein FA13DRAFT_1718588 [Coprinellus micaceus]|uniref:Uncharacterized protein n=1 Tax=Coprinellus micaceus TaxID=71717 RepID=A0A4Y7SD57_COPMI|nr:hypothetical protein FA13DRAFT_1718588 [Coprinellus micaceus]